MRKFAKNYFDANFVVIDLGKMRNIYFLWNGPPSFANRIRN